MTIAEIKERKAAIATELEAPEADLDALEKELRELNEMEKEIEKRSALIEKVKTEGKTVHEFEQEEREMTKEVEMRNTAEYGKAFVKAIMEGDDSECRALLSSNVSGSVPVPEMLETEIKNAWEEAQIMSLVKRTNYKGNVKVGFELSATGAAVHVEGQAAPEEEVLTWGVVELTAQSIKKWITVSDEAIEGTTIDTLGELYKEIAQRIVEKAEEVAIGKITSAPTVRSATACEVVDYTATAIAEDTMVQAVALLSGKAKNLHIAMNRQTRAAFKAVALKAKYNVDVFDGLEDRIVYTDALPAFSAAGSGDTYAIVGDFGYGFQANFPSGNDITIKTDELSLAEKDLVKIVGRQYVGMGVVAPKAFARIKA